MKKKSTKLHLLLMLLSLFAVTTLKAQTVPGTTNLYCLGSTVKMNAGTDPTATKYNWIRYAGQGTGGAATSLTTPTTNNTADLVDGPINTPGYYTYVSVAINSNGCESAPSDPIVIYVLPGITTSITDSYASNSICTNALPTTGTLTAVPGEAQSVAESFPTSAYTYQWFKNGLAISGTAGQGITYTLTTADVATHATDQYTVKINYSAHACTEVESSPVSINIVDPPAKPVITITP